MYKQIIIDEVKIEGESEALDVLYDIHRRAHPNPIQWTLIDLEKIEAIYQDGDVYRITRSGEDIIKRQLKSSQSIGDCFA